MEIAVLEEKIIDYLIEEHDLEKPSTDTLHTRIQSLEADESSLRFLNSSSTFLQVVLEVDSKTIFYQ